MPVVKDNFSFVILAIITISVLPVVTEFIKAKRSSSNEYKNKSIGKNGAGPKM